MNKDLIISSNRHETRVAIVEDEQLVEIYFQRADEYSLVGSIHKGKVTRVLPGMQSAFVDVGLERDAFLYVSDFFEDSEEYEPIQEGEETSKPDAKSRARSTASKVKNVPELKERRGRRSRRRRGRGRDFPESKYAEGATAEPTATEPVAAEPTETRPQEEGDSDFFVLPGESVAKYEKPTDAPAETDSASDSNGEASQEPNESVAASEDPEEAKPSTAEASSADAEAGDSGASETVVGDSEADSGNTVEKTTADDGAKEDSPETSEEDEAESEQPETDSEQSRTEDSDIQEMILGQIDQSVMDEIAAMDNDENVPENAPAGSDNDENPAAKPSEDADDKAPPAEATARVDEQEPRYHKRVSRRSRKRQRNSPAGTDEKAKEEPAEVNAGHEVKTKTVARPDKSPLPLISDLLKEGQEILVQIAKEPLGQKGARITSHIALPGRYVVYMPTLDHMGVSRKIASDEERQRLRRVIQKHRTGLPGGFIVRTAGEGQREEDISADMNFLFNLWTDIRKKAEKTPAPVLLHHDLQVVERILRDQVTDEYRTIWVDNEETYESVLQFLHRFQPSLVQRVRLYTRSAPIFETFNISSELQKALRPKVWLKSGGYIVINQTEALVAIDINTGKFVGRSNRLEDTIVKTNVEAIQEIVRQMRLRDLGGIIVVDFIDMDERKNRQRVMQALEEAMRQDKAPNKVLQFNDFGLVAITRKRVKQSLERALCSPCPYCEGAGYVKSVDTTIADILIEAHKLAGAVKDEEVILRVNPDVARELKSGKNEYLEELEETLGCPVMITPDPLLHHEKFDLA